MSDPVYTVLPDIRSHPLVQLLIKHLKQIEIDYYMEGKTVEFRAAKMRAEAQSGIDAYDNYEDKD